MSLSLLISIKIGMATAGSIQAWKAWEKTIRAGGRSSKKTVPKVKSKAIKISQRDNGDWMSLGVPR